MPPRLPISFRLLSLPSLKARINITLNVTDAQGVIFQFLDAPQFLHIYIICLFLVPAYTYIGLDSCLTHFQLMPESTVSSA